MERAPELQALQGSGESVVADRGAKGKQLLGFGLLGLVGLGAEVASLQGAALDPLGGLYR